MGLGEGQGLNFTTPSSCVLPSVSQCPERKEEHEPSPCLSCVPTVCPAQPNRRGGGSVDVRIGSHLPQCL